MCHSKFIGNSEIKILWFALTLKNGTFNCMGIVSTVYEVGKRGWGENVTWNLLEVLIFREKP